MQCRAGRAEWRSRRGRACACVESVCARRARRACMRQEGARDAALKRMGWLKSPKLNVEGGLENYSRVLPKVGPMALGPWDIVKTHLTLRWCAGAGRRAHPGAAPQRLRRSATPHHQKHLREKVGYARPPSFQRASFGPAGGDWSGRRQALPSPERDCARGGGPRWRVVRARLSSAFIAETTWQKS